MDQNLEEAGAVLDELGRVFQSDDDVNLIKQMRQNVTEMGVISAQQQADIKNVIRELSAEKAQLETQTANPPQDALLEQQKVLESQRSVAHQTITAISVDLEKQQQKLNELSLAEKELADQEQAVCDEASATIPAAKNTINLYFQICNIDWDYEANDVKGFMHMPNKKEIKPFHLTKEQRLSRAQVADHLWDMMWQDCSAVAAH